MLYMIQPQIFGATIDHVKQNTDDNLIDYM